MASRYLHLPAQLCTGIHKYIYTYIHTYDSKQADKPTYLCLSSSLCTRTVVGLAAGRWILFWMPRVLALATPSWPIQASVPSENMRVPSVVAIHPEKMQIPVWIFAERRRVSQHVGSWCPGQGLQITTAPPSTLLPFTASPPRCYRALHMHGWHGPSLIMALRSSCSLPRRSRPAVEVLSASAG